MKLFLHVAHVKIHPPQRSTVVGAFRSPCTNGEFTAECDSEELCPITSKGKNRVTSQDCVKRNKKKKKKNVGTENPQVENHWCEGSSPFQMSIYPLDQTHVTFGLRSSRHTKTVSLGRTAFVSNLQQRVKHLDLKTWNFDLVLSPLWMTL